MQGVIPRRESPYWFEHRADRFESMWKAAQHEETL